MPAGRHIVRGALLGLAAGCVLAFFTRRGSSIDLGVLAGVSLELLRAWIRGDLTEEGTTRRRRAPRGHRSKNPPGQQSGTQPAYAGQQEREAQDRELQLRAAAERHIGKLLSGIDRTAVLEQLRAQVPGLPPGSYAAALDGALTRYDRARERALARRHEAITRARDLDALGGVFTLELFNRHPGQPTVDVRATLGDLHDPAVLDDAIRRTEALLAHAANLGFGAQDARDDRAELQLAHPGFSLERLSEALNWGYYNGR